MMLFACSPSVTYTKGNIFVAVSDINQNGEIPVALLQIAKGVPESYKGRYFLPCSNFKLR